MSTYTWPSGTKDEASVAGGRLAEQLRAKIGLVGMSFDAARDAALAELLASSSVGGGQTLEGDLLPVALGRRVDRQPDPYHGGQL